MLGKAGPVGVVVELGHDQELGRCYPAGILVVALAVLARRPEEQEEERRVVFRADSAVAIEHTEDPGLESARNFGVGSKGQDGDFGSRLGDRSRFRRNPR